MARTADKPSRIEILLLSALARTPMSGYDLKLELRYKHVRWWAKCEHGHIYAALLRLARKGFIRKQKTERAGRGRRVFAISPSGSKRLGLALEAIGIAEDETYFDIDLFASGMFILPRRRVLDILDARRARLEAQLEEASALHAGMASFVPLAGRLIMDHRVEHLGREIHFVGRMADAIRAEAAWGSFLGGEKIDEFVKRTGVPLEPTRR